MGVKRRILLVITMLFIAFMVKAFVHPGFPEVEKSVITSSKECRECHEEIYGHWKNAMHSMSIEDPIFKTSYMESYLETSGSAKFDCLPCHAPIALLNGDYDMKEEVTLEGVSCDFCHSVKAVNLDNRENPFELELGEIKRGPLSKVSSPAHKTEPSPLFKSSELCAGCHEFTNGKGVTILGTYSEWKQSPYPEENTQCQNCHMPLIEGRTVKESVKSSAQKQINLHAISAGHSTEQLQKALKLEIQKVDKNKDFIQVEVDITNVGSGHLVPTGVPTRKLILQVELRTPNEYLTDQRVYQRILADGKGKVLTKIYDLFQNAEQVNLDTRLRPRETRRERFVFAMPKNKKITVSARIEYLFRADVISPTEMRVKMAEDTRVISR